jgi:hypothetical protein
VSEKELSSEKEEQDPEPEQPEPEPPEPEPPRPPPALLKGKLVGASASWHSSSRRSCDTLSRRSELVRESGC